MTSRELVKMTLEFRNTTDRVPTDLWLLPWANMNYPNELQKITDDFNFDIVQLPDSYKKYAIQPISEGDSYARGTAVDEWGVVWKNVQPGLVGEVKHAIVPGDDVDWEDTSRVHFPEELLTIDVDTINEFCASTDKFVLSSDLVRPFERMQFIRGTEDFLVDLALENEGMLNMLAKVHDFNCRLFEVWGKTNVDGLFMMDDWGSQLSLLINPKVWRTLFKPMYRDYANIAKKYGKKLFFHSDGNTLSIIPDLIELGFDAVNLQIFCIGVEKLAEFKGKITFWGEMDRQHLLVNGSPEDIDNAVKLIYKTLWADGGIIGQCEFGAGANPDLVYQLYKSWNSIK